MALTRQEKIQQIQQMYTGGQAVEQPTSGGFDIQMALKAAQENKARRLAQQPQQAEQIDTGRGVLPDVHVGIGKEGLKLGKGAAGLGERLFSGIFQTLLPKAAERALGIEDAPNLGIFGPKRGGETSAEKTFGQFEERRGLEEGQLTTPVNTPQKVGFYGAQVGEAFTPLGIEAGFAKAPLLIKGLTGGLLAGGESAVREGELNKNVALSTGLGGVGGALFGGLASRLGRARVAPFADKIDEPVKSAITRLGQRSGVQLSPSASQLSTSPIVPLVEGFTAKGIKGQAIINKINKFQDDVVRIARETVEKAGTKTSPVEIGQDIVNRRDSLRKTFMETKKDLYDQVKFARGGKDRIDIRPRESFSVLRDVIARKRSAGAAATDLKFFENILNDLQKVYKTGPKAGQSSVSAFELRNKIVELNRRLGNRTDAVTTGNKAEIGRLLVAMSDDLDNTLARVQPELGAALQKANRFYKEGIDRLNSSFGKKIQTFADQPDKLVDVILNEKTSIAQIEDTLRFIGKKNADNVRAHLLDKIFSKAKNKDGVFTPGGIQRQLNNFKEERLRKIFTAEQVDTLKDLAVATNSLSKVQKIMSGSQTAFMMRVMFQFGTFFAHPFLAIGSLLGDAAMGKFIASPTGQRLLLEGATEIPALQKAGTLFGGASRLTPRAVPKLIPDLEQTE